MLCWNRYAALLGAALLACSAAAWAARAHEHGVARVDVGVETGRVLVDLEIPLDSLIGFERAPRTDAEREKADAAVKKLRDGAALFRIDAGAGCTLARVDLKAPHLGLGGAAPAAGEHADLNGLYEFRCGGSARPGFVEVGLFEAFAGLKRIELQVVTPKGQLKATLRRPVARVQLAR